jgi:anti-sigma factor RsiW
MNCKKICEITADYVSDCLPRDAKRQYEAHVVCCKECAAELDAMRGMIASLGSLGGKASPVDCWPAIRERVAREACPKPILQRLLRPVIAAPVFAAVLLLAALLVAPWQMNDLPKQSPASVPNYSRYISAHARVQRGQAFTDPDVTFAAAELEKASLNTTSTRP